MTYETTTISSDATQLLAAKLAKYLHGGEIIELVSDLGGGKTTFVQGLVRALEYSGEITSPTFTLSHAYVINPDLEVHHYDLYRLNEGGILGDELAEDMVDDKIITVIEWAGAVSQILPKDRLKIQLTAISENEREIKFESLGAKSDNLLKGLIS